MFFVHVTKIRFQLWYGMILICYMLSAEIKISS